MKLEPKGADGDDYYESDYESDYDCNDEIKILYKIYIENLMKESLLKKELKMKEVKYEKRNIK